MWVEPTRNALTQFEAAETEHAAFDALIAFATDIGAELLSYHHIDPPTRHQDGPELVHDFTLVSHGFPDDWVSKYTNTDFRFIDPITAFAAYQTRPVLWSDIPHRVTLNMAQQAYLADLYRWLSPGDGLAVPVFGPSARHGYGGIGWRKPIPPWGPVKRRAVQSVFESFHLRICEFRLEKMEQDFVLDEQQMRILRAMSNGYPDSDIASRIGLDITTIRPEISKILVIMGVTDRPSALLRARALGLTER